MKRLLFIFVASILWLGYVCKSQSCDAYTEEDPCVNSGACKWVNDACKCASEVQLDILFGVDTSGSIGYNGFQIQKQFILGLVQQGIAGTSKIGFTMFNTQVNHSRDIQLWSDQTVLENYVKGIWWSGGWTNTPDLIDQSIIHFQDTYDPERQQIFMIITDGNPCLPDSLGGCPQSVCNRATQLKQAGIRTVIIGVGDGLTTEYVSCLTLSDDDFIPVGDFSTAEFNSILPSLSGILCPISKEFKITEVKAAKKESSWNNRWPRFVEIYNFGIDFSINDIQFSGLLEMTLGDGPSTTVSQGQYVVFYDASDPPLYRPDGTTLDGSTPSCHLCTPTVCELDYIVGTTDACSNAGTKAWEGACWCSNSVYVACSNDVEGTANCIANVADTNAVNACSSCVFQTGTSRTNWNVKVEDDGEVIDEVVYGLNGYWIETDDGYSYELLGKGYDNDNGDNWGQSCSVLGTPGSDPAATCDDECSSSGCGSGGVCDDTTKKCICDASTGYYPQCASANSCTKCLKVPEIENCEVRWLKNGTERYAAYTWTDADRDGNTIYKLSYFDGANNGEILTAQTYGELYHKVENYWTQNETIGGFVQTVIELCEGTGSDEVCISYSSTKTLCTVITAAPTSSPTPAPTDPPTGAPSPEPTMSPTWACPTYWWTNSDVCNPNQNQGYAGARCQCTGNENRQCCLLDPVWVGTYDENRQHKTDFDCKLDAQLDKPKKRDDESQAGTSEGYLLSEGEHYFIIDIAPDDYPCTMDIEWALVFSRTDCTYGSRRRLLQDTDTLSCDPSSTDLTSAGLDIDITSGTLVVHGADDVTNATVVITITRLDCDEARAVINGGDSGNSGNSTRRRLKDTSCFDNIALYGELKIVRATSRCQPDCFDGRIYPMAIPVWYNYAAALVVIPTDESPLPPWLWWLIAAMVVFLALLALLVYKYWWKNKATGAALNATQADLDAAVMEAEDGWAGDLDGKAVGFNPLATGFNPNAPAGAANPNAPPNGGGGGADFVRPNVEKPVFRVEYGQNQGANRMG